VAVWRELFSVQAAFGRDSVVPPLEGLWTMMIMAPEFVTPQIFESAVDKTSKKLGAPPTSLRLAFYAEGTSLQTLHIGSYEDEGPVLARLHDEVMPDHGYHFNGPHMRSISATRAGPNPRS
jgi:hypothetical protein